jgi:hypothetical protein
MAKPIPHKLKPQKAKVAFSIPKTALFVGSYHRIPIRLDGVKLEDVRFVVPDGARGGLISPSMETLPKPARPHIMLCVGYEPGTYIIEARHATTNALLGQAKFVSDALWLDENAGPTKWFTGIIQGYSAGAAWGGGPGRPTEHQYLPGFRYPTHRNPAGRHELAAVHHQYHRPAGASRSLDG